MRGAACASSDNRRYLTNFLKDFHLLFFCSCCAEKKFIKMFSNKLKRIMECVVIIILKGKGAETENVLVLMKMKVFPLLNSYAPDVNLVQKDISVM